MNPRRVVATLLEADDMLPPEQPAETFDRDSIKDFAQEPQPIRPIAGIPITGFYRTLQQKMQNGRLRAVENYRSNGSARGVKVDGNTWLVLYENGTIGVRVHKTDIITVTPDDTMVVDTGGWETRLTQRRLADWLPGGWRIYSQDSTWYWWNYKNEGAAEQTVNDQGFKILQPFSSGDQIAADGTLNPVVPPKYVRVKKPRRERF
jgi:hypothetical protein